MNKQRKVLITTTYNEMGIIIDTKAEKVAQPLNQDSIETQSSDLISRQAALELCDWYDNPSMREDLEKLRPARFSTDTISRAKAIDEIKEIYEWHDNVTKERIIEHFKQLPPVQPEPSQVAKDIVRIAENGQDMRVIAQLEIIRCKDCKHWIPYDWMFSEVWRSKNIADYPEDEIGCNYCDMTMKANDFCSRGERKTT